MSEIKLTRVDDRLIHAQILLLWVKTTNINTIVLVDDEVANNPFLAEIYRLAMPTHIRLHVKTVEEAITYDYSSEPELWHDRRTLVLMKTLDTAYRLLDAGFPIESLQIGGSVVEQETDRKKLLDILLSQYPRQLSYLISANVTIYCQKSPQTQKVYVNKAHAS